MELLLLSMVAAWVVKNGVTDLIYSGASAVCAVRGKPSPTWGRRSRVRLDGAATRYFSRLWTDSWEDALARHDERRAARSAPTPRPGRPRGAATQFLAGLFQDGRRKARRSWDGAWTRADERRRERTTRPRPGQVTVPGEVVPNQDGTQDRPQDGDRPDPEPVPAEDGLTDQDEPIVQPDPSQLDCRNCIPDRHWHDQHCMVRGDDPWIGTTGQQDDNNQTITTPEDDAQGSSDTQEGPTTMTTTIPTGEVAGLEPAITFCETSAQAYAEMVHRIEQTQAALAAGDVTGPAAEAFSAAMDQSQAAAVSMTAAADELKKHRVVAEAYDAVAGAGTREFVRGGR